MLSRFFTFGGLTTCSRVMGFIRDLLMASYLGVGLLSDVFFVAFRLPNLFRALFAEGAFNSSFTPLYLSISGDHKQQAKFVANISTLLVVGTLLLCLLIQVFMPFVVGLIAPGFIKDPTKFESAVFFARVMFPYLFLVSIVAFFGSLLQAHKKFFAFASAPIILNCCMIASLLFFSEILGNLEALSYSIIVAGFLQCLWMYVHIRYAGIEFSLGKIEFTANVQRFLKRFLPATFGMGIAQISVFVDTIFASIFVGAVSYFYYADRLVQFPLAIVGVAMSVVILPYLSNSLNKGESGREEVWGIQNRAIKIVLFLITPASVALATLPVELTSCVYYYGSFDASSLKKTSMIVLIFAFALPAFVLNKIFSSVFFAMEDTKTPAVYSGYALILNILLNMIFVNYFQYNGIAWATVASSWFNFFLMARKLIRSGIYKFDQKLNICFLHAFIGNAVMMLCTQSLALLFHRVFLTQLWWAKMLFGGIIFIVGIASYFVAIALVRKFSKNHTPYSIFGA